MLTELIVGERRAAANVQTDGRAGPYSELIVSDAHGRYFESARNLRIYHTLSKAVTVAATHNSPIAAATATPVLAIGNPVGSGRAANLLRIAFSTTSGTPAGGQAVINVQANVVSQLTAAVTGSIYSAVVRSDASPQGSVMKAFNNVALGGWVSTIAPLQEIFLVGAATGGIAAAGNGGPGATGEDIAGSIIIPPGALCALMAGSGAGTTWIVNAQLTWEEIDWPLV